MSISVARITETPQEKLSKKIKAMQDLFNCDLGNIDGLTIIQVLRKSSAILELHFNQILDEDDVFPNTDDDIVVLHTKAVLSLFAEHNTAFLDIINTFVDTSLRMNGEMNGDPNDKVYTLYETIRIFKWGMSNVISVLRQTIEDIENC